MIMRTDVAYIQLSEKKRYHKFGFIKNNRFYFMIDPQILNTGFSVKELSEIIEYMKESHPTSEFES